MRKYYCDKCKKESSNNRRIGNCELNIFAGLDISHVGTESIYSYSGDLCKECYDKFKEDLIILYKDYFDKELNGEK